MLFKSSTSDGLETQFEGNYINSANISDVLDIGVAQMRESKKIKINNNTLLKGARIKSLQ